MPDELMKLLCMVCGEPSYLTEAPNECPHCGDIGTPANLDQTASITLTKHELRILTFWSDAYARLCTRMGTDPSNRMVLTLKTIFDRISMQTDTPLSFSQDIADFRQGISQKYGTELDAVFFDATGKCMECNAQLDALDNDSLFAHRCGASNELPASDEEDTPPLSS